jgi:hypothetical protein
MPRDNLGSVWQGGATKAEAFFLAQRSSSTPAHSSLCTTPGSDPGDRDRWYHLARVDDDEAAAFEIFAFK